MHSGRQKLEVRRLTKSFAMTGDIPANNSEATFVDINIEYGSREDINEGLSSATHGRNSIGENDVDNCDRVEEGVCSQLEDLFGDIAHDDVSDDDSGCELFEDDTIPHISDSSEDEYEDDENCIQFHANYIVPDELLHLGKTFNTAADFKYALLKYSLKTEYDIKLYKSTTKKLGAICSSKECPWRVYCSFEKSKNKLMIKVYIDEHVCNRSGYTKMLKIPAIAELFEEPLKLNPKLSPTDMMNAIKTDYNLNVTLFQCEHAKKKVVEQRRKMHGTQFGRLWDYEKEIIISNPGSTVDIETFPGPTQTEHKFYRIYICFEALREAWKQTCRRIIGLDGAFLKWDIKGELLAAVGRDANNRIFPIAWAIVDIENNDNWEWFIKHIQSDLDLGQGNTITIISDKQKGLVNVVHKELPQAEHRMCARHILANWRKTNKDKELEPMFWKIARSYTTGDFEDNLEALKVYNSGAYESLLCTRPTTWSRAFFRTESCTIDNSNNLSESFNKTIREARRKPLLDMLEDIRRQTMVRNAKRSTLGNKWKGKFTKRTQAEIEKSRADAKDLVMYQTTGGEYEIDDHGSGYRVDIQSKTCGCRKWQLKGIPCSHAMRVITGKKLNLDDYVSGYFTTHMWQQTYARGMRIVQGMKLWPRLHRFPIIPPDPRPKKGRKRNHNRCKEPHEDASKKGRMSGHGRTITCSHCKEEGHNKTTCSNPHVVIEKRPRGRPVKNKQQAGEISHRNG